MIKDITGQKFGKVTVIDRDHQGRNSEWYWICRCDCGNITVVSGYRLRSGHTKSCGCLQEEQRRKGFNKTHGMTDTRIYYEWSNMKARCYNKNGNMYYAYGGRGISVCDEWRTSFVTFMEWALSHGYTDEMTLDRIDVNGNYCPENCRWIPPRKQYLNRSDNHIVEAFGQKKTIKEWADETGLKYDTIERRINAYGWTPERAVSEPAAKR